MKLLWEILVGKFGQIIQGFVPKPSLTHSMEKDPLLYNLVDIISSMQF